MNKLSEAFNHSTDAVFGIDAGGRIRYANRAFEQLLGHSGGELCGSQCANVLCGTDMHGRPFCGKHCPIPKTVTDPTAVRDFDLVVKHASGNQVLVNIGASYIPPSLREQAGNVDVFFCLREVNPQRLLQRMARTPATESNRSGTPGRTRLTAREQEILGLAARGLRTMQIASRLSVSTQTIRTHFKNIYPKLGVNSRTEAVVYAMNHGLH
jgi:DNA-binding CsgD family transcriptional regulator